jgi:PAS domain-containing protein
VGAEKRLTTLKEKLGSQRAELEAYLEKASSMVIVLIDSALNILDCNQGFLKMFQLHQKPLGVSVADFLVLGGKDLNDGEEFKCSCNQQSGVGGILSGRSTATENGYLLFCERLLLTESQAIEQVVAINNELINLQ